MKIIFSIIVAVSLFACKDQEQNLETTRNTKAISMAESEEVVTDNDSEIITGKIRKKDLQKAPHSAWFEPMFKSYSPDPEQMEIMKEHLGEYKIKAFMGTWCADSQREIPKLFKILEASNFDMSNFELQGVTLDKTLPKNLHKELDIYYVPTIIFYKQGKEVGRFVEFPQEELEHDIAKIVSGQDYAHPYE